jgi:hypothetical protein
LVLIAAAAVAAGCSGSTVDQSTGVTGPTALDRETEAVLQARAMERACRPCEIQPVCVTEETPPGLVSAIERVFPLGVKVVEMIPGGQVTTTAPGLGCLGLDTWPPTRRLAGGVVGVDVRWTNSVRTYWFKWVEPGWVEVTPEDVGATDTTIIF